MALDSISTIDLFQRKNVIVMWGDFNYQYDKMYIFLTYYNNVVIIS